MTVGAWVGSRLLNMVLSLAVTSSSAYLLVLSGVFSVVKRPMFKYVPGVTTLGGSTLLGGQTFLKGRLS
jgi:hypothetical protein